MIEVDGYKAFKGVMRISEKRLGGKPYDVEGDWLYDPNRECWYVRREEDYISAFSPYHNNLDIIKDYTEKE